jgi:hypothetical protein
MVGRNDMKLRNITFATFVAAAAVAFVIGSAVPSEAAKKKMKEAAAPPPQEPTCLIVPSAPVCATKGGQKFTYANSCYAMKDGASGAKAGACNAGKAAKSGGMKKSSKKKS